MPFIVLTSVTVGDSPSHPSRIHREMQSAGSYGQPFRSVAWALRPAGLGSAPWRSVVHMLDYGICSPRPDHGEVEGHGAASS